MKANSTSGLLLLGPESFSLFEDLFIVFELFFEQIPDILRPNFVETKQKSNI
jgi:hypothetical protein